MKICLVGESLVGENDPVFRLDRPGSGRGRGQGPGARGRGQGPGRPGRAAGRDLQAQEKDARCDRVHRAGRDLGRRRKENRFLGAISRKAPDGRCAASCRPGLRRSGGPASPGDGRSDPGSAGRRSRVSPERPGGHRKAVRTAGKRDRGQEKRARRAGAGGSENRAGPASKRSARFASRSSSRTRSF